MTTRRVAQKEATREHLYAQAMRLFHDRGYDAVSVEDIVREAGVARGTFYVHFPKKEDILIELIRRSDRHIVAKIAAVKRGKPLRKALEAATSGFADIWRDQRHLLPHAGAVALRRIAEVQAERDAEPLRLALAPHVEAAAASGELRRGLPPQMLADLFLLDVFAALMAWAVPAEPPLEIVMGGVIDLFLNGASAPR